MSSFILAVATLIGTIIGVGMFALPYAAAQAGWGVTLIYLAVLGGAVTMMHLVYGEIVLRTQSRHRLAGYARIYLGWWGKWAGTAVFFVTLYLALLAYLIIGGEFLRIILEGWWNVSLTAATMFTAAFGFWVIWRGLKLTGFLELVMVAALVGLVMFLVGYSFKSVQPESFSFLNSSGDAFLPYGVILFALAGGSAIPEIRNFFIGARARLLKKVIIWGTLIPVAVYAVFITVVVGLSGLQTSPEALEGLAPHLGSVVIKYGALMGFLAVITSFFTIGLNIKNAFHLDFGWPKFLSWLFTASIPLILFFYGTRDFIGLLAFGGAVLGGFEGILVLAIWTKSKKRGTRAPEYSIKLNPLLKYLLILVFLIGIMYEIMYTL